MPLSFYSMATQLQIALRECGYETTLCNDRYPDTTITRILWKLGITKFLYNITTNHITRYFLKEDYDICIIIKGYGISTNLIKEIRKKCPYVVGYNFDSFAFHSRPLNWYKECDKFMTFDYHDAKQYNLPLVELYSADIKNDLNTHKGIDLFVLQKVHSDRLEYLDKSLNILTPITPYIYLFESNWATAMSNFARHPFLYFKFYKFIHFKPLPYSDYSTLMFKSKYTLDYAHPKQSGITMRCFEAANCGTMIVTNNSNVTKNKYFYNDSIICLDLNKTYSEQEKKDIQSKFLETSYSSDIYKRTIIDFVKDLICK